MIEKDEIMRLVNCHLAKVLRAAELALTQEKFLQFRSIVLNEFGRNGFRRSLERLLHSQQENNKDGSGWHKSAGREV
jgi:hypothetical protein